MEENKNVEAKAEETKVQEQANVPAPQQEEPEVKPSLVKRGLAWGKRNGLKILKGAGLMLAGVAVGAFVGMTINKRDGDEDCNSDDNYGGDDYGWQPEPEDNETEINDDFNFDDESEEEAS